MTVVSDAGVDLLVSLIISFLELIRRVVFPQRPASRGHTI
jgi:hypothetical protein